MSLSAAQLALGVAEAVHRDVDGDVDPELLRQLPLVAHDVGLAEVGAARGQGHRDQALVVAQVLLRTRRARSPSIRSTLPPQSSPNHQAWIEVFGKPNAKTERMPVSWRPFDRRVGVVRRVHDVRPVDERRDARVDALERAPLVRGVDVLGPVLGRELVEDRAEVGDQRVVRRAGPDRRLPGVAMGVDEARDDDVAGRRRSPWRRPRRGPGRPRRSGRPR